MRKLFLIALLSVSIFLAGCAQPNTASQRIADLKLTGHDRFALIGKSLGQRGFTQKLRFANDSGLTVTCHNLKFEFDRLRPSIDGTGEIYTLEFRGVEPNVDCYGTRQDDDSSAKGDRTEVLQFYDFVPIKKN